MLDLDFALHVLELLFRLGEFCCCFLTTPLESAFGNAPLLVLLYEPRRLTVKALDIRRWWMTGCHASARPLLPSPGHQGP